MLKKTMIVLGLSAITIASMQTSAMAGGSGQHGYEPLYWNGPAGTDHNVLFTKGYKYRIYAYKGCKAFKRRYVKSGKKVWLRKYQVCKVDQY